MSGRSPATAYDHGRLTQVLGELRSAARMDVAFGGGVRPDTSGLEITSTSGTSTTALHHLRIAAGHGLGGKSLVLGRPVAVADYVTARGITHTYDAAVRGEHLRTVVALPVVVDRQPRMVVYLAHRSQVGLGDRWYDSFAPLVRRLERDVLVEEEVRRRLARLTSSPVPGSSLHADGRLSPHELREVSQELTELAGLVEQDDVRIRLQRLCARLAPADATPGTSRNPSVALSAREVDVLEQVALGLTNRQVAAALGLVESTVKSYLKSAARKLGASNRVHAVRLARELGLIR